MAKRAARVPDEWDTDIHSAAFSINVVLKNADRPLTVDEIMLRVRELGLPETGAPREHLRRLSGKNPRRPTKYIEQIDDRWVRCELLASPHKVADKADATLNKRTARTARSTAVPSPSSDITETSVETARPANIVDDWLTDLADIGIRRVFQHLAQHGAVTETEVAEMLGSPRESRKFSRQFEQHAASAPFTIRIDSVSGVKRYVREGVTS